MMKLRKMALRLLPNYLNINDNKSVQESVLNVVDLYLTEDIEIHVVNKIKRYAKQY